MLQEKEAALKQKDAELKKKEATRRSFSTKGSFVETCEADETSESNKENMGLFKLNKLF